ncbi:nicotianamine synthase family protein [Cohnella abietis]|uniref:Nicotianamine synthase n=1 Tax=Cohnella abietis TaxID=2507935 RepID=A0A3T1D6B6_9BACL|nr:nicotianamine synthase family protein [Cohnella abietis]BBI33611.1 hypothetical protein KCTCHS21_30100 [Cohnella abietis]
MAAVNSVPEGFELLSARLDCLCEFIVCEDNEQCWKLCGHSDNIKQAANRLREISAKALCEVEKIRSYRAYNEKGSMNLYSSLLSAAVKEEWTYGQIDQTSKVIFIGAGATPLSAFTIAKETSAHVICIDIDDEAIHHGRKLTHFLDLQRIVHYSDSDLKSCGFLETATHVFIASLVPEKLEILEELKSATRPECKIIVRYGNGLKSLFNYPLHADLLINWHVDSLNLRTRIYDTLILSNPKSTVNAAMVREMSAITR